MLAVSGAESARFSYCPGTHPKRVSQPAMEGVNIKAVPSSFIESGAILQVDAVDQNTPCLVQSLAPSQSISALQFDEPGLVSSRKLMDAYRTSSMPT